MRRSNGVRDLLLIAVGFVVLGASLRFVWHDADRKKNHGSGPEGGKAMLDLLLIAITVVFFVACLGYVAGCERL
jgi:hypothetical protein